MGTHPAVILLVDDNADDIYLTRYAFEQTDISNEIVLARDGIEALALLLPEDGREPLRPAIVLLDINMPRMGGLEVLARLRADPSTRALPVIVLSTSTQDRDMAESYSLGANSYVSKPVTLDEFLQAAKALGVYWLGVNQQPTATVQSNRVQEPPGPGACPGKGGSFAGVMACASRAQATSQESLTVLQDADRRG